MRIAAGILCFSSLLSAQSPKDIRDAVSHRQLSAAQLAGYMNSTDDGVRYEAVKGLTEIGTAEVVDPLIRATHDNNADVQARAVTGLVNFYLPGYLVTGKNTSIRKLSNDIASRFNDPSDQIIDPYVVVRPDVITAIGRVAVSGTSINARTEAARALGVLRGQAALPDLLEALKSKDTDLIYESVLALKKIEDPRGGPGIHFLLRDKDERLQLLAIETTGILRNREAAKDLEDLVRNSRKDRVRRAALSALAMMPAGVHRDIFVRYLGDKDEMMRTASAEGLARLANQADLATVEKSYADEGKPRPRLALAFAQVMEGKQENGEYSPLRYLIYNLNSAANSNIATTYLTEATAVMPGLRPTLYEAADTGTRDEKIYLARVFSQAGDRGAEGTLQKLSHDSDSAVSQEGIKALKVLHARV